MRIHRKAITKGGQTVNTSRNICTRYTKLKELSGNTNPSQLLQFLGTHRISIATTEDEDSEEGFVRDDPRHPTSLQ